MKIKREKYEITVKIPVEVPPENMGPVAAMEYIRRAVEVQRGYTFSYQKVKSK